MSRANEFLRGLIYGLIMSFIACLLFIAAGIETAEAGYHGFPASTITTTEKDESPC